MKSGIIKTGKSTRPDLRKTVEINLPMILDDFHRPVLLPETLELLKIKKGGIYIDATLGGGGFAAAIAERGGRVLGFDLDPAAIAAVARQRLKAVKLVPKSFIQMKAAASEAGYQEVDGVVFDLGLSSYQLDGSYRGFSFKNDEPLDMRFDPGGKLSASVIINEYSKEKLYEIFTKNSEELNSREIADAIVRTRALKGAIRTTADLNRVVEGVVTLKSLDNKYKILTRIYMAIRIEVNNELNNLKEGLLAAFSLLTSHGRLAVISYHSLEDRIIKMAFLQAGRTGGFKILTSRPLTAGKAEKSVNPRSRSAKLRVGEKI